MLMAKSGHTSAASLAKYAPAVRRGADALAVAQRPGPEAMSRFERPRRMHLRLLDGRD